MKIAHRWSKLLLVASIALPMAAQQQPHVGGMNDEQFPPPERLGTVHFETSCAPAVTAKFDRAVALLHSFWFPAAIAEFNDVLKEDPSCGIAYWGISLSTFGNPFGGGRSPKQLQDGLTFSQKAEAVGAKTERERDYIAAVGELYKDSGTLDEQARKLKYEAAMEQLAVKYPKDSEAQIFYALAIVQTAVPTDKTYAKQLQAVAILEEQLKTHPDHPGIAHYIIHSYDTPALAPRGLPAARLYANIAPSAPHALHMPSHIFTRVGDWDASIAANVKSVATSRKVDSPGDELHADDYLTYAYLQEAQDQAAKRVLDDARRVANNPENVGASSMAGSFALAAIAARYVIEREAWGDAKALEVHPSPALYPEAMTRFVRAIGFAQAGDIASAKIEIAELEKLRDALVARKDAYWSEQVEIQRISASAWVAHAESKQDEALSLLRSAAEREDATDKSAITPGPLKPVREQLGEMLLAANQPTSALTEFEATLKKEPNRFRAVYGAARAAELSGDHAKATAYYRQLLEICKNADSSRPELKQAREFVAQAPLSAQRN